MSILLTPETQRLIEDRMKLAGFRTPDDLVRHALEALDQRGSDESDEEDWAAIEEAEAQYQRGEGIPLDQAFDELRRKHLGR